MTNWSESPPPDWSLLASRLHGLLLRPGDAHYALARQVWNAAIDRQPAAIVVCARDSDASEAVRFASNAGLKVTVRGGGHNVAGRAVQEGALMVDLSALRAVRVDVRQRQVEAGGGATWRDVDAAAGAFGLAVPGGLVSSTGIGGLTLGGGIGWLMRRYGLSSDNLLAADVVLADGRLVRTSAAENPRLFWALRGGGGQVGVVTRFVYGAHPVSAVHGHDCAARAARSVRSRSPLRPANHAPTARAKPCSQWAAPCSASCAACSAVVRASSTRAWCHSAIAVPFSSRACRVSLRPCANSAMSRIHCAASA
jgi:hypothetical protein